MKSFKIILTIAMVLSLSSCEWMTKAEIEPKKDQLLNTTVPDQPSTPTRD